MLVENPTVRTQAEANSSSQFVESPDLSDAVTTAVLTSTDAHGRMTDKFFANDEFKSQIIKLLGQLVHSDLNRAG